ncbi:MAG: cyclic nucleotide-binding domain-containing protein [Vicinamibacteria bacterium]|nr:cyclic nucleotide-binding domain-containing protein [Vicinamibacteria bacterium]
MQVDPLAVAALRGAPLFGGLADPELRQVAALGRPRAVGAGATVFQEGDEADCLYAVLAGRLRVLRRQEDGRESPLTALEPGAVFGELALLDSSPRSATVVALEPCSLLAIDRADFLALLAASPALVARLFASLASSVRRSTERFLEEELASRMLAAESELARHRALSQMVAGVAHELNTPLGVAVTAGSVLRRELSEPALAGSAEARSALEGALDALGLLERNLERAHRLVDSFKKVSVAHASEREEEFDVAHAIRDAIEVFRPVAKAEKLDVRFTAPEGSHPAFGRPGLLIQALTNLLTNAARYAYPGGTGGVVDVSLSREASGYRIAVRDRGVGIAAADLDRVFEPFFTTGRARGGTGLGLAIVRSVVTEGLGGQVSIASEAGRGTEVGLTLPRPSPA